VEHGNRSTAPEISHGDPGTDQRCSRLAFAKARATLRLFPVLLLAARSFQMTLQEFFAYFKRLAVTLTWNSLNLTGREYDEG
jgi:hypothetical protein